MELIYAYAEKYRIFERKEFCFSDKFIVKYDRENNHLSIKRNPDYIDIYPENIVGISAIVGKNASGKTSLLDMIGDKLEERHRFGEIIESKKPDPYLQDPDLEDLVQYSETPEERKYTNKYFLIYYWGKKDDGQDLFILETDWVDHYMYMLSNIDMFYTKKEDHTDDWSDNYFWSKAWISCVFSVEGDECKYRGDTQKFLNRVGSDLEHVSQCSIVSFKDSNQQQTSDFHQAIAEEHKIMVLRRYAPLVNRYFFKNLKFIIAEMKKEHKYSQKGSTKPDKKPQLYWNPTYEVVVNFADSDLYVYDDIFEKSDDYNECFFSVPKNEIHNMTDAQKIYITILMNYSRFIFHTYVLHRGLKQENREIIAQKIKTSCYPPNFNFQSLKQAYLSQINIVFDETQGENFIIEDVIKRFNSLWNFLVTAKSSNIRYRYEKNALILTITRESNIDSQKEFFTEFIDFPIMIEDNEDPLCFQMFIRRKIQYLSEGEQANLAMYASIEEQINDISPKKQKYILLFDEIERCMHPEMCRNLISDLINLLKVYDDKEFQIIIASHSPFIVGDLRKENLICLGSGGSGSQTLPESPFGQNIHTLLRSQFFLDNTLSEYSVQTINLIADCLSMDSVEKMQKLIWERLDPGEKYPWKLLPKGDQQTLQYLNSVISAIGEPMIRNSLQDELDRWKRAHLSRTIKQTELDRLKAQVAALEKELGENG